MNKGILAIGGSRQLSTYGSLVASYVTTHALSAGFGIHTGCCKGVDAAVMSAAAAHGPVERTQVFCVFGPPSHKRGATAFPGTCGLSAVSSVLYAVQSGVKPVYCAGGHLDLPLSQRLAARTAAVVDSATAGGIVIIDGEPGPGSLLFMRLIAARGLPCWRINLSAPQTITTRQRLANMRTPTGWQYVRPAWLGGLSAWLSQPTRIF